MKNCLTPNNPKMCDPIVVTVLKMRPRNSQSGRENATPSSDTSPSASYKKREKKCKKKKKKESATAGVTVICVFPYTYH